MSDDDRMGTSEEEEEEDEDEGHGINMMNFMFGNVDSHGELEGDFLDEVCVAPVLVLTCLGNSRPEHRTALLLCRKPSRAWVASRTHELALIYR